MSNLPVCKVKGCSLPAIPGKDHCNYHQKDLFDGAAQAEKAGTLSELQPRRSAGRNVVQKMPGKAVRNMSLEDRLTLFEILCGVSAKTDSPEFAERMEQRTELLADSLLEEAGISTAAIRRTQPDETSQIHEG